MSLATLTTATWPGASFSLDNYSMARISAYGGAPASQAWGTQYRAVYAPIRIPSRCVVKELGYASSNTRTGNIDIGLYNSAGVRLVSKGSTAKSSSIEFVALDVTDTTIGPGLYYMALSNDTTTDTFMTWGPTAPVLAAFGILAETLGSVVLPATATWAVPQTLSVCPVMGALLVTELT